MTAPTSIDLRPGDDYNDRTTWDELLIPAGWTCLGERGGITYWRRPGKVFGISATTGYGDGDYDCLFVFSTSTTFKVQTAYFKFGAYAHLHHGDDYTAAARQLAADGYGSGTPRALTPFQPEHGGSVGALDEASQYEQNFDRRVSSRVFDLDVEREAKRRITTRDRPPQPFDAALLADVVDEPINWRVDGLIPAQGRLLLSAQRKTGKTTATLNLAHDLLTGDAFLDRFDVTPISGKVCFLNYEVSSAQLARWARDADIPADRFLTVGLRGRRNPLGDPTDSARLVELLISHGVEVLIVDPFGRAFTGTSQNDAGEVGAWLSALDTFAVDAGISEVILTAHAGWNGERTRGSTALEDWADAVAFLVRDPDDDTVRYFRAMGRDVDVDEDRLEYDPTTRRLSLTGAGSRKVATASKRHDALTAEIMALVTASPGINGTQIGEQLKARGVPFQKGAERQALSAAVNQGLLQSTKGARGAKNYDLPRPTPTYPDGVRLTYPDPTYRGGVGQGVGEGLPYELEPGYVEPVHACAGEECQTTGCRWAS